MLTKNTGDMEGKRLGVQKRCFQGFLGVKSPGHCQACALDDWMRHEPFLRRALGKEGQAESPGNTGAAMDACAALTASSLQVCTLLPVLKTKSPAHVQSSQSALQICLVDKGSTRYNV